MSKGKATKKSEPVRTALGEMQYLHNVYGEAIDVLAFYGPLDDVLVQNADAPRPPEGDLEWLHVFATFSVSPVDLVQNPRAIDPMTLLKRAARHTDDILWVSRTDIDGSTFVLGFLPEAFHDKSRRAAVLDLFEKEFRRLVNIAKEHGTYSQPILAEYSPIGRMDH